MDCREGKKIGSRISYASLTIHSGSLFKFDLELAKMYMEWSNWVCGDLVHIHIIEND